MRRVSIVGGGLVGSLLAVMLRKRGNRVVLYDQRTDPRAGPLAGGRSINLIATVRGIHALRQEGLWKEVSKITVPVLGRSMHNYSGRQVYQPYGKDDSECNHSVSRSGLNNLLLTAAEESGAELCFDHRLVEFDPSTQRMLFASAAGDEKEIVGELIFGADGAASKVRAGLMSLPGAEESVEMLPHGYKEVEFPAAGEGEFVMDPRALHIWPRGEFMLMGLPNPDGSFTGTVYLPFEGMNSFALLHDAGAVSAFFEREFPDAVPLLPDLTREFFENPTGELGTVRCTPWHVTDRVALIGDSAHAIVPFFGQGMNCGFEDCTVLAELLEQFEGDWEKTLPAYDRLRKPNADAIAEMALDNFVEMRERVGDPGFLLRKEVEHRIEQAFPKEYRTRYSMVVYSRIPYEIARLAGRIQVKLLDDLCDGLESAEQLDLATARALIHERLTPFIDQSGVRLDY